MEVEEKKSVKDRIVDASWRLFYEKGYDNTTVDDIIALSDTSKGSFYYYFATKDALLGTLSTLLDALYGELEKKMDPNMNSMDQLLLINYEAHAMMEKRIRLDILASLYSTQLLSKRQRHLLDKNRTYYKLVSQIIEKGQKKGELNKKKSIQEMVSYFAMSERALIYDWCLNQGMFSLKDYSKEYLPLMLQWMVEK